MGVKTYAASIIDGKRHFKADNHLDIEVLDTQVTINNVPGLADTRISFCAATITDNFQYYTTSQVAINADIDVRGLVEKKFGKIVEWTEVLDE